MYVIDKGLVVEIINQMFGSCENYTTYYRFFFLSVSLPHVKLNWLLLQVKIKCQLVKFVTLVYHLSVPNHIKDVSFLTIVKV